MTGAAAHGSATTIRAGSSSTELVRAIGRWGFVAVVVNSVVGSGIYALPSSLARFAGVWSPVTVFIAGAGVLLVVLCLAEVACRFDQSGGPYLYSREAFGPAVGFQIGWLHTCTRIFSAAAVLNVLVDYLSEVLPWAGSGTGKITTMTLAMASATYVNVIGVKQASRTLSLFTIAKLLPLAVLIGAGIWHIRSQVLATQIVTERRWTDAVLLLIFAYGGFDTAVIPAGEARTPKRDSAFGVIFSLFAIMVLYSLIQLVVVGVLPDAKASQAPIADALRALLGPAGLALGSVGVIISIYGWIVGTVLTMPRLLFAMGTRGEMPAVLARVHARYRTPHVAILSTSIVSLFLGLAGGFEQLAALSAIMRLAIFAATCAAMIQLRRQWGMPDGFVVPAGTATALGGIGFCLWLLSTRDLSQAWVLPLFVVIGWIVWRLK